MAPIKIQLNSLEALERLIGGNTELEMELRNSVAQDFTKKYLKGLVTTQLELGAKQLIPKVLKEEGILENDNLWNIRLTPQIVNSIKNSIDVEVKNRLASEAAQKVLTPIINDFQEQLKAQVALAVDRITGQIEESVLTGKINSLVNARIKEKLGI